MKSKRIAFGIGIVLAVLAAFTAPAMAADYHFHFVPDEVSVAPGENVTVWSYLNTTESTTNWVAAVVYEQDKVECLGVEEGDSPDWYLWNYEGTGYPTSTGKEYFWFKGVEFFGHGPGDLQLGKITLRCVNPGVSILHYGAYPEIPDGNNQTYAESVSLPWTSETLTFTCTGPPETFKKALALGWNLISLPLIPEDNSTSAVLGNDTIEYDAVYRYNATSKQFEDVTTGTMDPGIGYFVNVTTAGTWSYKGTPYTSMSIPLKKGLNLVGWLNCTKQISGNLSSIAGKYNYIARWNAGYEVYEPHAPEVFNDFFDMERGNGYWIAAKQDCKLEESCSG